MYVNGRYSETVMLAVREGERRRRAACTCGPNVHLDGPCGFCEGEEDRAEDMAHDPDPATEELGLERMERMHERHLDQIGGSA